MASEKLDDEPTEAEKSHREILAPTPVERLREMGRGLGMEVPRRVIELYLRDAPVRLAALSKSLADGDAAAMEQAAHSLKGSSANLGAVDFADLCGRLEKLAGTLTSTEARERFGRLEAEYGRVEAAMRELLAKLS